VDRQTNVQKQGSCRLFSTWFVSYIRLQCVSNGHRIVLFKKSDMAYSNDILD
jgi:hypothetical protein